MRIGALSLWLGQEFDDRVDERVGRRFARDRRDFNAARFERLRSKRAYCDPSNAMNGVAEHIDERVCRRGTHCDGGCDRAGF